MVEIEVQCSFGIAWLKLDGVDVFVLFLYLMELKLKGFLSIDLSFLF